MRQDEHNSSWQETEQHNQKNHKANHKNWMRIAIDLAKNAIATARPNPRVGCVIVKDNEIIGKGWHKKSGEAHAEINALQMADDANRDVAGADVYLNLEPCAHHGKTPPCVDELITRNIGSVYIAVKDPNPKVSGKSIAKMQQAGIKVECGLLEDEARMLNRGFFKRHEQGIPWVRLKLAQSLNGEMAKAAEVAGDVDQSKDEAGDEATTRTQEKNWITSKTAREDVHRWRATSCAVLSGAASISQDNSRLNVRLEESADKDFEYLQPLRIALDPKFSLAEKLSFFATPGPKLWVGAKMDDVPSSLPPQTQILQIPNMKHGLDLPRLLAELGKREINELMVETGPRLSSAFLEAGLVDELIVYLAPLVLRSSQKQVKIRDDMKFSINDMKILGDDLRLVLFSKQAAKYKSK